MRSIIGFNGLVYALKRLPLIGRIIPDSLYASKELKFIYRLYRILKELFVMFIGKIVVLSAIYLLSFIFKQIYIQNDLGAGMSEKILYSDLALMMFLVFAGCGAVLNLRMFRCTTEKEYMVFMLRMDAKKLDDSLFLYDAFKLFIGYLLAGVTGAICGAPFILRIGIPVLAVMIKLFGTGALALFYEIKHKHNRSMKRNMRLYSAKLSIAMVLVPMILIVFVNGWTVPFYILLTICALLVILGIWGFYKLKKVDPFLHRKALQDNIIRIETEEYKHRKKDNSRSFKKIRAVGSVNSDKKGFAYLNALFVRRHRGMLYTKPLVFTIGVAAVTALYIYASIREYYQSYGGDNCLNMVLTNLKNLLLMRRYDDPLMPFDTEDSLMLFLRWLSSGHLLMLLIPISMSDNTYKATQAMYINCDSSLMTLSVFKQPKKILELFDIRLKQLFRMNMTAALAYGIVADLILFYSGGADHPLIYIATPVVSLLIQLIYMLTELLLYYLFQPFTMTVNIKSGAYIAFSIVKWIFYSLVFWIPCNTGILMAMLLIVDTAYIVAARKLVFRFSPVTWRVKS